MKPFLLIQSRPERSTLDNEYDAFCLYSGLGSSELVRIHADRDALPYDSLDKYSGVFMGGGPAHFTPSTADASPQHKRYKKNMACLMTRILDEDKPFLGVCLGMGAIVTGMGGEMSFDHGEPLGAATVHLTDEGRHDTLLQDLPDTFLAISGHKEGAGQLPSHAVMLARNNCCAQIIRHGHNVYATQFHPELDEVGLRIRMEAYRDNGYYDPKAFDDVVRSTMIKGVMVSQTILRRFVSMYQCE